MARHEYTYSVGQNTLTQIALYEYYLYQENIFACFFKQKIYAAKGSNTALAKKHKMMNILCS